MALLHLIDQTIDSIPKLFFYCKRIEDLLKNLNMLNLLLWKGLTCDMHVTCGFVMNGKCTQFNLFIILTIRIGIL